MQNIDLTWWIQVVELPILGGLFMWFNRLKSQTDLAFEKIRANFAGFQKDLSDYKLEVARGYASISYIKDVEARLTNHLLRIEKKLEKGEPR
ncbi:MAG: hypothetical protein LBH81_00060 [Rickettsiales bacterium]|jgi:hypothetical protein|nr:hypothetical protein [Rickettsiales bacterium]